MATKRDTSSIEADHDDMELTTAVTGVIARIFDPITSRLVDHVIGRHSVHVSLDYGRWGHQVLDKPVLIVTAYNRSPRPQRVDSVFLTLSDNDGILMLPDPGAQLPRPPKVISEVENFSFMFPLEGVATALHERRAALANDKIHIAGAGVNLASGRRVKARKRIDIEKYL
jgi:hypothetical protein